MKILQKLIATGLIALLSFTSIAQAAETVTYFHNDLLGSPAAATDESGEIIWRENYQAFGEKVKNQDEQTGNVIGYTGHVHDEDTGLTYMQARYYDPVIGRFYANDPVGFVEESPVSFNRYAYANNNPYKYVDPDGEFAAFGFAVGVALEVLRQRITGELDLSLKSAGKIAVAGLAGASGAGLGRGIASLTASVAARAAANTAAGAAVGAAATVTNNAIDQKDLTEGLGKGAALGALGGAAGSLFGDSLEAATAAAKSGALDDLSVSAGNLVQHIDETTKSAQYGISSSSVSAGEAAGNFISNSSGVIDSSVCKAREDEC